MLLFIVIVLRVYVPSAGFNTSHVAIYPLQIWKKQEQQQRFNTSHVAIYHIPAWDALNIHQCFNTSHVAIYQMYHETKC